MPAARADRAGDRFESAIDSVRGQRHRPSARSRAGTMRACTRSTVSTLAAEMNDAGLAAGQNPTGNRISRRRSGSVRRAFGRVVLVQVRPRRSRRSRRSTRCSVRLGGSWLLVREVKLWVRSGMPSSVTSADRPANLNEIRERQYFRAGVGLRTECGGPRSINNVRQRTGGLIADGRSFDREDWSRNREKSEEISGPLTPFVTRDVGPAIRW